MEIKYIETRLGIIRAYVDGEKVASIYPNGDDTWFDVTFHENETNTTVDTLEEAKCEIEQYVFNDSPVYYEDEDDGEALASAGFGTDEDYGYFGE